MDAACRPGQNEACPPGRVGDDDVGAIAHGRRACQRRPGEKNERKRLDEREDKEPVAGNKNRTVAFEVAGAYFWAETGVRRNRRWRKRCAHRRKSATNRRRMR